MTFQTGVVIALVLIALGSVALAFSPGSRYAWVGNQTGYAPQQPIEFSHALHVKDHNIACSYCHAGAEKGPIAGIPPVQTCMSCHSEVKTDSPEIRKLYRALEDGTPIEWVRVHSLPDFVAFDHSAHVAAGVSCQTCHGPVEAMVRIEQVDHMNMGWCVSCHRDYDGKLSLSGEVLKPSLDCSTCHH